MKYRHFTEMPVWQNTHELTLSVYEVSSTFPKTEQYALTSQIRRAVVSVGSNIAEGFGRHHNKSKAQFYRYARGSLYEVEHQVIVARDLGYLSPSVQKELSKRVKAIIHSLNKIIKTLTG